MAEKNSKNLVAIVKKLVKIKGTLYLCIPRAVARQFGVEAGDQVGIIAAKRVLTVFFPGEPGVS